MDTISNLREAFTDYRLRHPVATVVLIVVAVGAVASRLPRRARQHSALTNLLVVWPVKICVAVVIGSVVMLAAAGYGVYRLYPWARAKWEGRRA